MLPLTLSKSPPQPQYGRDGNCEGRHSERRLSLECSELYIIERVGRAKIEHSTILLNV